MFQVLHLGKNMVVHFSAGTISPEFPFLGDLLKINANQKPHSHFVPNVSIKEIPISLSVSVSFCFGYIFPSLLVLSALA